MTLDDKTAKPPPPVATTTGRAEALKLVGIVRDALRRQRVVDLPERVRERLLVREDQAEVLVRLMQLAIVTIFAALYAASPKVGDTMMQAFTPAAIGGYFVVTIIGLIWSLRARLPDWAVYWSSVMDLGLLFAMIWSFHLQYGQPAAFYLKAPTLLYVFIFISLRALRFQARFVIGAGLLGALGWLALVVYAIESPAGGSVVTRDYVDYLTGNLVLIGGEVDKIVSILMVTAVLALAIRRARRTLVEAVAESTAAEDLSRYFDASVAEKIRGSAEETVIGRGQSRTIAIVNLDIRGFTTLAANLPPAEVMALLAEYQSRFVPIIRAHGGTIDKFLGDGIMATFGGAKPSLTFAADALRAVDEVIAEAGRWQEEHRADGRPELRVNVGAASGSVVAGAVGDATRLEYTVIGTPVNLAAKLEKHNKTLGTAALTTAETLALARTQGYAAAGNLMSVHSEIEGLDGAQDIVILHASRREHAG